MAAFDVFLSYAHADRERVLELRDALVASGLRVWLDDTQTETFESISAAINTGLARSARFWPYCADAGGFLLTSSSTPERANNSPSSWTSRSASSTEDSSTLKPGTNRTETSRTAFCSTDSATRALRAARSMRNWTVCKAAQSTTTSRISRHGRAHCTDQSANNDAPARRAGPLA